jgi:ADP-ribose pyrophosphatase YjhB (NUDIX family)
MCSNFKRFPKSYNANTMMTNDMNHLLFQYCPKMAVISQDKSKVLLCRRKGEVDYDGVFSLIGGKMEHRDADILDALRREKSEEVGDEFKVRVLLYPSVDVLFCKKDGARMILPHFYSEHVAGAVNLSDEYSEARWVSLDELDKFTPKIENISWIVPQLMRNGAAAGHAEFVEI